MSSLARRELLAAVGALGIGTTPFQRALATSAAQATTDTITPEMVKEAEWIAGITLTDAERRIAAEALTRHRRRVAVLHKLDLGNAIAPAFAFNPAPWLVPTSPNRGQVELAAAKNLQKPASDDDLAFAPLTTLAELIRTKQISSTELTKLYLARLKKYNPALLCVVTITEELALQQAQAADKAIATGAYRGPLHGIPWAAKDLIAYPGYKTTWGAKPFQDQELKVKATVAQRLDEAGAVLVGKTTLGALAMGDVWFGGTTRNPWNIQQGSSGSSAGTASAVAAGLVGFGLGSETHGSIISPSSRCGVTGLRPTFGRVSRYGCMTLSWTLDKIGPMGRSVEDCALVLAAIHGFDRHDAATQERPFQWPAKVNFQQLRVGVVEGAGISDNDRQVLANLGVKLVPITLPRSTASALMEIILDVEAAAAFDDLTRAGVKEGIGLWERIFRRGRFISAVDYLSAQRARLLLMEEMAKVMEHVDLYVGGADMTITNLTGHPTICLPNGFRNGTPTALTFTGRLFDESTLLAVAKAYQDATGHHLKRPPLDKWIAEKKNAPQP